MPKNKTQNKIMDDHALNIFDAYLLLRMIAEVSKNLGFSARNPNFPSELSEYVAQQILTRKWNLSDDKICRGKSGDLIVKSSGKKIEVKCFSSQGPISFGPKEKWDHLILIDATKGYDNIFKVYEVPYSNNSSVIQQIKVNKSETFGDHALAGKRPRLNPKDLFRCLGNKAVIIAEGTLKELLCG